MKKVVIYRAADAFLYLPTYIAEHRKIFQTIDKELHVEFCTPGDHQSGDIPAMEAMFEDSHKHDILSIALCDPLAMFSRYAPDILQPKDLRLIGALITKPSFWGVNKIEGELSESGIGHHFKKIIYYDEALTTGHFIGKQLRTVTGISSFGSVNFGQEINTLLKEQEKGTPTIAITADIVGLAKEAHTGENITINHRFSKNPRYSDFLTTGLITTAMNTNCPEDTYILRKVVEGIQRAIFLLRSSKEIACSVCQEIAVEREFYQDGQDSLTQDEVSWIIDQIYEENFYPMNLAVSKSQWVNAVKARGRVEFWEDDDIKEANNMYQMVVHQEFSEAATWQIVSEFGVSKPTPPSKGILGFLKNLVGIILGDAAPLIVRAGFIITLLASIFFSTGLVNLPLLVRSLIPGILLLCIFTFAFYDPALRGLLTRSKIRTIARVISGILAVIFLVGGTWLELNQKPMHWVGMLSSMPLGFLLSDFILWMQHRDSTRHL